METFNYNITNKDDVFQLLLTSKKFKIKRGENFFNFISRFISRT